MVLGQRYAMLCALGVGMTLGSVVHATEDGVVSLPAAGRTTDVVHWSVESLTIADIHDVREDQGAYLNSLGGVVLEDTLLSEGEPVVAGNIVQQGFIQNTDFGLLLVTFDNGETVALYNNDAIYVGSSDAAGVAIGGTHKWECRCKCDCNDGNGSCDTQSDCANCQDEGDQCAGGNGSACICAQGIGGSTITCVGTLSDCYEILVPIIVINTPSKR